MRLFIAVELPEKVRDILIDAQKRIRFPGKATLVNDFHLTLKFLGEVEDKKVPDIISVLSKISFKPFDISLSGIGVFPNKNSPRVLWVGMSPEDKVSALQKDIDSATLGVCFAQGQEFHPHITLSRIKFIDDKKAFASAIDNTSIEKVSFKVSSFKLIRSTLTPKGPIYEVLKDFKSE